MAISIRGTQVLPARPASTAPSKAGNNSLQASVTGASAGLGWSIVVGDNTGTTPAHFTDVTHPTTIRDQDADQMSYSFSGGAYTITMRQSGMDTSAMTLGHHLWAMFYATNTAPSGADAPDAVFDLGVLVA